REKLGARTAGYVVTREQLFDLQQVANDLDQSAIALDAAAVVLADAGMAIDSTIQQIVTAGDATIDEVHETMVAFADEQKASSDG
ncbi:MAG TPA: hypothetical protein VGC78_00135, partial [Gaiellaceae bacterium]